MAGIGEGQEEGVAAELEEGAAVLTGQVEKAPEAAPDHVGHLFGACPAASGQALREAGEPGHVDEDERAVDLAPAGTDVGVRPLDPEFGQVWSERAGRGRDGRPPGPAGGLAGQKNVGSFERRATSKWTCSSSLLNWWYLHGDEGNASGGPALVPDAPLQNGTTET